MIEELSPEAVQVGEGDIDTSLLRLPVVCVDVETTGLDPRQDQIVEIAAVKVQRGVLVDEFSTLVSIDRPMPAVAQRVHGISDRMLRGQPCIGEALGSFLVFAGDSVLAEHSHEAFDVLFLDAALGEELAAPYLNTCTLARHLVPELPSHSLAMCCEHFGIRRAGAHRALADARALAALLCVLLPLCVWGVGYRTLDELLAVASVSRTSPALAGRFHPA